MSLVKTNAILDASGGTTATVNGYTPTVSNMATGNNRIINGAMMIDQRNAGASVTLSGPAGTYTLDRWLVYCEQASKLSVQKNAGSVTPPTGFTNYLGATSLSAYAIVGNDSFSLQQVIEGFNVADLNWGTTSAIPATLSFWVRSSLTGTFGGSIATTKTAVWAMPFTFTISSANTWTYVTVSITAPTSTGGTNTDNTQGVYVRFGLGSTGTTAGGTAGIWSANNYIQPTGTVSVVGTSGATFYITGVQLEAGSVATPFEHRQYGQELALCQRYYTKSYDMSTVAGTATSVGALFGSVGAPNSTSLKSVMVFYPVTMRSAPTATLYDLAGNINKCSVDIIGGNIDNITPGIASAGQRSMDVFQNTGTNCATIVVHYTASAEL